MKLTFHGAVKTVTGSNFLLGKILVDCGLHQGASYCEKHNFEPFPYDPKTIEAVLVTHAHIDHIGRIPQLYRAGFKGKIVSTPPTKDFAEELLVDSEHILAKEAEEKRLPPIYELTDVGGAMDLWETARYHQKIKIADFDIEFFDAGHILGSSFIKVSGEGKTVVFSGDLGNIATPIVKDTEPLPDTQYVLIESTYGGRLHEELESRRDILEDLIEDIVKSGGALMIPAFAMERTQDILFEINELVENNRIPPHPIFIDSPLAIKLTSVYKKYSTDPEYVDKEALELLRKGDAIFDFPGLKFTLTTEQSKEINEVKPPKIIIAGSGMSQGGRILHHEKRYLPDPKSAILFIGYQAQGSLGRLILDGAKYVKVLGEEIPVRCRVKSIGGYSAHADQKKLLEWLAPQRENLEKVFVVQGEEDQSSALAQKIRDELAINSVLPWVGETVVL